MHQSKEQIEIHKLKICILLLINVLRVDKRYNEKVLNNVEKILANDGEE